LITSTKTKYKNKELWKWGFCKSSSWCLEHYFRRTDSLTIFNLIVWLYSKNN